jgi:hypothetical protein
MVFAMVLPIARSAWGADPGTLRYDGEDLGGDHRRGSGTQKVFGQNSDTPLGRFET